MTRSVAVAGDVSGRVLTCAACGITADGHVRGWRGGWRAYLVYDQDEDHFPYNVIYCSKCAEREYGPLPHAQRSAG